MGNWAGREVLGDDVRQKGSLVDPDKTRFDLSHHAQLTEVELARIEAHVNRLIDESHPVYTKVVDQAKARKINTLRAVFGEKYPDEVRVVSVGVEIGEEDGSDPKTLLGNLDDPAWLNHSVEFCGGTHVKNTGEIGCFRLIEESAVAKGIRRVVGITGDRAQQAEARARAIMRLLTDAGTVDGTALPNRIAEITAEMNQTELPLVEKMRMRADLATLQNKAKKLAKQAAKDGAADIMEQLDELLAGAEKLGDTVIITAHLGDATVDQLRAAADSLRDRAGSAAVLLATDADGKVMLLAAMTKDVIAAGAKAGDLIKAAAPVVGGKGGGRPDMAQGGGPDVQKIPDALKAATAWLRETLS